MPIRAQHNPDGEAALADINDFFSLNVSVVLRPRL